MNGSRQVSQRRFRVLMLIPQPGYGGAEQAFLRVASFISKHADVTIALMARDHGKGIHSAEWARTGLSMVMLSNDGQQKRSLLAKGMRWWLMLRRLGALKGEHDVAISFLSGANLLNALSGPKGKTIVSERGSKRYDAGASKRQRFLWARLLDPLTYSRAQRIVVASEGLAREIIVANPWVADRVIALEGTIHARRLLDDADAATDRGFDALLEFDTIVAFGRLHKQKGFDFLLRAFAKVRCNRPAARLILIGDGPEGTGLLRLAHELGLKTGSVDDVAQVDLVFAGYQENPLRFARFAKLFAFTSRGEGLPNALIEALAAGIPVFAADSPGGVRSILCGAGDTIDVGPVTLPRQLEYGTLMPMPDARNAVEIWSNEIARVLQRPIEKQSRQRRYSAIERFDIDVTGPQWMDLVTEVIEGDSNRNGSRKPRHAA